MSTKTITYYNENAQSFIADTVNANVSELHKIFTKYVPNGHILDLGCGAGRDARYFLEQNYTVTALDGSEVLAEKAALLIGQPIIVMDFCEMDYDNLFDGIWACASLLHVPRKNLNHIFSLIERALKKEGILYASFKYGNFEGQRSGRYFTDFTEKSFSVLMSQFSDLKIEEMFVTQDVRSNHAKQLWLNVFVKKC